MQYFAGVTTRTSLGPGEGGIRDYVALAPHVADHPRKWLPKIFWRRCRSPPNGYEYRREAEDAAS
jgi:hypothetical protein